MEGVGSDDESGGEDVERTRDLLCMGGENDMGFGVGGVVPEGPPEGSGRTDADAGGTDITEYRSAHGIRMQYECF
jgi:hypothetical protein